MFADTDDLYSAGGAVMFEIFSRLGSWLVATLRGSEDGTESGTLHVLKTDSAGRLEVTVAASGELSDLDDVADTLAPASGDLLKFDGAEWDAGRASLGELSDVNDTPEPSGPGSYNNYILGWTGAEWDGISLGLEDINQVDPALSPSDGEMLIYDSAATYWEGLPIAGEAGSLLLRDGDQPAWSESSGAWELSIPDGNAVSFPISGVNVATLLYAISASTGEYTGGSVTLVSGDSHVIFADGTNSLTITYSGSLYIQRTAGTATFTVALMGVWL